MAGNLSETHRYIGIGKGELNIVDGGHSHVLGVLRGRRVRSILRDLASRSDELDGASMDRVLETLPDPKMRYWAGIVLNVIQNLDNVEQLRALKKVVVLEMGKGNTVARLEL